MEFASTYLDQYRDKHVLVAPLNWGLGHATRCLPIIDHLKKTNEVTIASDGLAMQWLQQERPELPSLKLPNYPIRYTYSSMTVNVLQHGFGLWNAIKNERRVLRKWANKHQVDLVISDHRFGMYLKDVTSIFLAHQLTIPHRNVLLRRSASMWQSRMINKFDACWIPDYPGPDRLSGLLSEEKLGIPKHYIGPLSRFQKSEVKVCKYDLAVILSGKEPTRSGFEDKLMTHLLELDFSIILVRGTTTTPSNDLTSRSGNLEIVDLADSRQLQDIIDHSDIILSRSGYSTIMDLDVVDKPAILIPTPGQPEQEYLAKIHEKRWFIMNEDEISSPGLEHAMRILSK